VHSTPPPPSQRSEIPLPREVDAIVLACLEKDPDKRPQDAAELLRMIEQSAVARGWSSAQAEDWWQLHLAELSGPLTFEERRAEPIVAAVQGADSPDSSSAWIDTRISNRHT
jgi:hypothetical protein